MENLPDENESIAKEKLDEEMNKVKAKDTLRQVKIEMGLLYKEIEEQADSLQVNKTIGSGSAGGQKSDEDQ